MQRQPWTCREASTASGFGLRNLQAYVAAAQRRGFVEQVTAAKGPQPATWRLTRAGRRLSGAPVMVRRRGYAMDIRAAEAPAP